MLAPRTTLHLQAGRSFEHTGVLRAPLAGSGVAGTLAACPGGRVGACVKLPLLYDVRGYPKGPALAQPVQGTSYLVA